MRKRGGGKWGVNNLESKFLAGLRRKFWVVDGVKLCQSCGVPDASPTPYLSICPVCQNPIDVSVLEPFSKIACPHCGQLVRVRRNFDHFRIVKQIGEGGMSRVFEAEDETLGRRVALKILNRQFSRDANRVEQFKREALVTARISHLNVIKLYSTGQDHGYFYIAMELVGGGSLEQRIKSQGRLGEEEVLRIGLQVAEGLRAAQKDGLLHRDVKPANILFTDTGTAKVVDFGLAIFVDQAQTDDGELWATPYYVAPEKVLENREDHRSDIFSLGATLYHALTGKPPHKANTASLAELRQIKGKKVLLEDTGLTFSLRTMAVVNRMLAVSPEARHPDYDAVVEDLRVAERLVGGGQRLMGGRRQKFMVGAAAAVVLAFAVGWFARSTGQRAAKSIVAVTPVQVAVGGGNGVTLTAGQATVGERFRQARERVLAGASEEGERLFGQLLKEGLKQPTLNWARFHLAVCLIEQGKEAEAAKVVREMTLDSGNGGAGGAIDGFFKNLGNRLVERWGGKLKIADLKYARDSEEVAGYLLHGLAQWHFGDPLKGVELMQFFFDSMPTLKASLGGSVTTADWVAAYADGFKRRYGPDLEVAVTVGGALAKGDGAAAVMTLAQLEAMKENLQTNGMLRAMLTKRIQGLRREEVREAMVDQKKIQEAMLARRQREQEQLQDLTELLPSLVHGHDYSKVLDVVQSMAFETPELKAALDGKVYLYSQAQAFMHQLMDDVARKPWRGKVRRTDGSSVDGSITAMTATEVTVTLDRGVVPLPTAVVSPETLVEAATAYTNEVTDSTDYYRRQELTAVFARVAGLHAMSAMIAAPLMEENREFRMRWLKVL
jgi:hypothetical protein